MIEQHEITQNICYRENKYTYRNACLEIYDKLNLEQKIESQTL